MSPEVHFVQAGDAPVLLGAGDASLPCGCGNVLIDGFDPAQFLGVGIRCGRCGRVTTSPPLAAGRMLPSFVSTAEPSAEPRARAMQVPPRVALVGRAEMERLAPLFRPATPDPTYRFSQGLLDQAEAAFERHVGGALPAVAADPADPFTGLRDHALAWSVRHLRARMGEASWAAMGDAPTANAVDHVAGFLHFVATWSRHPLFPAMATTVGDRGCSLHGLAPFAAAHALALLGNRVGFEQPAGDPARVDGFNLAVGAADTVGVHLEVFDRFEYPFGQARDPPVLRAAVLEVMAAAQGRINLRSRGVLLLSPGSALAAYDEALIEAVQAGMQTLGRKNRGLMAVAPIVLRLQAVADPHAVRFGYGLFPVVNRHYSGDAVLQGG
ncbi:hypothetical protein [Rhodopila sp.]|uniref:hypothetical protein n=1 Tax=Rhodopila sp. TaxID=2480087 RepID=UPI003D1189C8